MTDDPTVRLIALTTTVSGLARAQWLRTLDAIRALPTVARR